MDRPGGNRNSAGEQGRLEEGELVRGRGYRQRSAGATAKEGAVWVSASIGVQAGFGLVAQLLLARWLDAYDFGLFALTMSTAFAFDAIARAGVRTTMTQQTPGGVRHLGPGAFGLRIRMSILAGTGMVILVPAFVALFDEPALVPLLVVTAVSLPLGAYADVAIPACQAALRFRQVAAALLVFALVNYGVSVALAGFGFGAMSLVLGVQVGLVAQAIVLYATSRYRPWGGASAGLSASRVMIRTRWAFAGDFAADALGRVDYFVLGLFAPTAVVGGYFFAFQLVAKGGELFLGVSRNVLFPVLSQLRTDAARQGRGLFRAAAVLVFAGGVSAAVLIAAMGAIEELVWQGKWADVVPAIAVLASALPAQLALAAPLQLLKARGSFRAWTVILLARAIGLACVTTTASLIAGAALSPTIVAIAVGSYLALDALLEIGILARILSFSATAYWRIVLPLWALLVATGWMGALAVRHADLDIIGSLLVAAVVVGCGALATATVGLMAGWLDRSLVVRPGR